MQPPPVELSEFSTPDQPPSSIQSIGITPWPDGKWLHGIVPSWNFSLGPSKGERSPKIPPLLEELELELELEPPEEELDELEDEPEEEDDDDDEDEEEEERKEDMMRLLKGGN